MAYLATRRKDSRHAGSSTMTYLVTQKRALDADARVFCFLGRRVLRVG